MNHLAKVLRVTGRIPDAHRQLQRAFAIRMDTFGRGNALTIATAMSLASIESDRGDAEAAIDLLERFPPSLAESVDMQPALLADYYRARGKLLLYAASDADGAIEAFTRALVTDETEHHEPRARARDLTNLAVMHRRQKQLDLAEARGREALELALRSKLEVAQTAAIRVNLANVLTDQGRFEDAARQLRRAVEPLEARADADATELVIGRCLLAAAEARVGNAPEARRRLAQGRTGIEARGEPAEREADVCDDAAEVVAEATAVRSARQR